jgi:hypothetical protein
MRLVSILPLSSSKEGKLHRGRPTSPTRVPRKRLANSLGLNRAESLQLLRLHRDLSAKAHFTCRTLDERHTIRVERFVDGRSARLGAGEWDAGGSRFLDDTLTTLADSLDNGGFHSKFNPIQGDEPDDVL